jgi:photosystem II stability/assembly factor-like uncharacterized protein
MVGERHLRRRGGGRTTDGGAQWSAEPVPPGTAGIGSLVCPGTKECIGLSTSSKPEVLGSSYIVTSDGGTSWRTVSIPSAEGGGYIVLNALACSSPSACTAVGYDRALKQKGVILSGSVAGMFGVNQFPAQDSDFTGVTCPRRCLAWGSMSTGPSTWPREVIAGTITLGIWANLATRPYGDNISQVTCAPAGQCQAYGYNAATGPYLLLSPDLGGDWEQQALAAGTSGSGGAACPSQRLCFELSSGTGPFGPSSTSTSANTGASTNKPFQQAVLASSDGGQHWASLPMASVGFQPTAAACATTANCVEVGSYMGTGRIESTANLSKGWAYEDAAGDKASALEGVACPSATVCVAVGGQMGQSAQVVRSTDGGLDWSGDTRVPSHVGDLDSISCPTATICYAGGGTPDGAGVIVSSADGGATWAGRALPQPGAGKVLGDWVIGPVTSVSCPTPESCYALASRAQPSPAGGTTLSSVVLVSTDSGAQWTARSAPKEELGPSQAGLGAALSSISCPLYGPGCYAAGTGPDAQGVVFYTSDGARHWSQLRLPKGTGTLSSIACPDPFDCFATGTNDDYSADIISTNDHGTTWTVDREPPGLRGRPGPPATRTRCASPPGPPPGRRATLPPLPLTTAGRLSSTPPGDLRSARRYRQRTWAPSTRRPSEPAAARSRTPGPSWEAPCPRACLSPRTAAPSPVRPRPRACPMFGCRSSMPTRPRTTPRPSCPWGSVPYHQIGAGVRGRHDP